VLSGKKYHPNMQLPVSLPLWILAINYKLYNRKGNLEEDYFSSVCARAGGEESRAALKGLAEVLGYFWLRDMVLH